MNLEPVEWALFLIVHHFGGCSFSLYEADYMRGEGAIPFTGKGKHGGKNTK